MLLVPASALSAFLTSPESLWTFVVATLAVIPLAEWIRRGTEHLAERAGPAIGGLLNVSFGNTAELILALFVLAAGKPDVVKAQMTGAIIGNSLLGLGLAIIAGSWAAKADLQSRPRGAAVEPAGARRRSACCCRRCSITSMRRPRPPGGSSATSISASACRSC